jgi:hypothetical protein
MNAKTLPPQFAELESFVPDWALPDERARYEKLASSDILTLRVFYDAMMARIDEIIVFLDSFSLDAMPPDAATLFDLALTFMETAHPIDLNWPITDIEDKFPAERFIFLPPSARVGREQQLS